MCLPCATPVRGSAYGVECLASVLGPDVAAAAAPPARAPDARPRGVARIAFAVAVAATILPWSRFGPGSEAFGAWSRAGRWSVAAAVAAVLGLVVTFAQRSNRLRAPGWDVAAALLGAGVAVGSMLAVVYPAAFSRPWLGPWIASAAGAIACGATVLASRARTAMAVHV
jgi:lysylphosphatidylglycerol synthetase-like protein (DUF2156 family)